MSNTFHKFPSIEQFRTVLKYVRQYGIKYGIDCANVLYEGTVKLHGTNAGVVITKYNDVYAQSRNNIITSEADNAGFAKFVEANEDDFINMAHHISMEATIGGDVIIYGEWCGGNIQSGVGINGLDKMFVIFDIIEVDSHKHIETLQLIEHMHFWNKFPNVFHIKQFPTYSLTIDFNNPDTQVKRMVEITEAVEAECPVAKHFGKDGIGEGVVWTPVNVPEGLHLSSMRFKVKGEKHSISKVKTLIPLTPEQIEAKDKLDTFITNTVTENRVLQAMSEVGAESERHTGDVIRWVYNDIVKEESDTMVVNNIDAKMIGKSVAIKAKTIYFNLIL